MAREHARILCAIWRPESDFRNRSPESQRLYFLLLSQRELNNAGVLPLMPSKWARCSSGTTVADVEQALEELIEHRFVIVDRDTEEVLVRSFMRNDGVLKHTYMRRSALRSAEQIESPTLRREVARELIRIDHPDGIAVASRLDPEAFRPAHRDPVQSTTPTTHRDAIASGTSTTQPDPIPSTTSTTQLNGIESGSETTHGGRGGGRGRGSVPSVGGQVGGSRTRAQAPTHEAAPEPPPAAPRPPNLDPANPRCARHRDIPAGDPGPNCIACRDVRLQLERQAAAPAEDPQLTAWRAAVKACPDCDDRGKIELADGSVARHHGLPGDVPAAAVAS